MYNLPKEVNFCIETLEKAGFEAWCVGGAVRDILLGLCPSDYDIATNAKPEDVKNHFEKCISTGEKHGTVTVIIDKTPIEVTTYRTENDYSDSRHPDAVNFVNSIEEDLSRRDFTVNSIAYHQTRGVLDLFGGEADLKEGVIRTVGIPEKRFFEDALRILRAYRFSSQLNFKIDPDTNLGAAKSIKGLERISVERIFTELQKLLMGFTPSVISDLVALGALKFLGLQKLKKPQVIDSLPKNRVIRFSALCISGGLNPLSFLKSLKADSALIENTENTLKAFMKLKNPNRESLKVSMGSLGAENTRYALILLNAYNLSKKDALPELDDILLKNEAYSVSMLKINGNDLKELGYSGKKIGDVLKKLLDFVISHPESNRRDILLSIAQNL